VRPAEQYTHRRPMPVHGGTVEYLYLIESAAALEDHVLASGTDQCKRGQDAVITARLTNSDVAQGIEPFGPSDKGHPHR
jgi:hypothetical protein